MRKIRSPDLEIRNPKSEIRNRKSEIRNPKSEIRSPKSVTAQHLVKILSNFVPIAPGIDIGSNSIFDIRPDGHRDQHSIFYTLFNSLF